MKIKLTLSIITVSVFLFGCGYEIVNKSKGNNFSIAEINLSGEKRINYNIKNRLKFNAAKENTNLIKIDIETSKNKTINNKNIKNEITSYELSIKSKVTYALIGNNKKKGQFEVSKSGTYKVSNQRLDTLNSEKKLVEILTDNIFKDISTKLNNILNDS